MEVTAVYPGSFDPPTNGHLDIVERALTVFPRIIVAVVSNPSKETLFSLEERIDMLESLYAEDDRIEVSGYEGLLVDFVKEKKAKAILRGLRAVSDFEYEFQMALMNRRLQPEINSVYLMPSLEYEYLSSSLVKEVFRLGGDVKGLIPPNVEKYLEKKFK